MLRKVYLTLVLVILLAGSAYGVSSDDVYLRKDVFEAKMDAFMSEIRLMNMDLRREMDRRFGEMDKRFNALDKKIDDVKTELHQEIQDVRTELKQEIQGVRTELKQEIQDVKTELKQEIQVVSSKVDLLDERTENTKTFVYWGLTLLGIILASAVVIPPLLEFFAGLRKKEQKEPKEPSFTLEDVKHLIRLELEELNKTI